MAEAWARRLKADQIEAYSAGIRPSGLDPRAVAVMAEVGINISAQRSKHIDELKDMRFDYVITVCDQARQSCPIWPGAGKVLHVGFDDPPALASSAANTDEAMQHYRRVRDQIKAFVEGMPENLSTVVGRATELEAMHKDSTETIRQAYAEIARSEKSCCGPCGCTAATALGYDQADLKDIPDGTDMGLGCGNPVALASLKEGEVVLDLGCGPGLDVFVAARKVGPKGKAIGVDMTAEMLAKARAGIEQFRQRTGLSNVEFRLGQIEYLPVADASVDVVLSNCVINLSADKPQVWREIARVLKPGGRVAVSDLVLLRPLPDKVKGSIEALVGCVAGAILVEQLGPMVEEAGLADVSVEPRPDYIQRMADWSDQLYRRIREALPEGEGLGDYVTSAYVTARKPEAVLSERVKELIALGASVTANCHPCLRYHLDKARQLGIDRSSILQAIEVGKMVRRGAAGQMDGLIKEIVHYDGGVYGKQGR